MEISHKAVADLFATIYEKQAAKYGGETTLNELRVIAACYQAFTYGRTLSVSKMSSSLGIPTSTVHRAVTNLIRKGWLIDSPDPHDGRRRIIALSDQGVSGGLWRFVADFIHSNSD